MSPTPPCPECGGPGGADACTALYHRLLALDFSLQRPWGPHHEVTTPCYLLQHPSWLAEPHRAGSWVFVHAFLDGGLARVDRLVARRRAANSHRRPQAELPLPEGAPELPERTPPTRFAVTIADLAVDGTFPADGFAARAREWARAVSTAWLTPAG